MESTNASTTAGTANTATVWYTAYIPEPNFDNFLLLLMIIAVVFAVVALAQFIQQRWFPHHWNKSGIIKLKEGQGAGKPEQSDVQAAIHSAT